MSNTDIRQAATMAGVRLWEIADRLGMADSNFSRKLRHELPENEKRHILEIIDKIKEDSANE